MRRLDQHGEKKTKPWWVGAEITDTSEPLIISRLWCSPNSVIFSYAIDRRDCMQHHNVNQHSYRPRPVEGPNACWSCQTESKSERYWIFTLLNKAKKRKNKSKKIWLNITWCFNFLTWNRSRCLGSKLNGFSWVKLSQDTENSLGAALQSQGGSWRALAVPTSRKWSFPQGSLWRHHLTGRILRGP